MDEPVPNPRPHLPVVVQPDPMHEESTGLLPTVVMSIGAVAVVVLVLYGMTRPEAPERTASAPSTTAPAQPAAGNAQPQKPEPSTTGRGQSGEPSRPEKSAGSPPRSDSSNSAGPKNQPQQQAQ